MGDGGCEGSGVLISGLEEVSVSCKSDPISGWSLANSNVGGVDRLVGSSADIAKSDLYRWRRLVIAFPW